MSKILTLVGRIKSFLRIDTLPFLSFLTEEMLTTKFLESSTRDFGYDSPVDKVKNEILFEPS